MCVHYKYLQENSQYCLINTTINVTDILINNESTDVSYVSITAIYISSNGRGQPHNFTIIPDTNTSTFDATFHYNCVTDTEIGISIIVFDKCGQQSLSKDRVINCILKGIVQKQYGLCNANVLLLSLIIKYSYEG